MVHHQAPAMSTEEMIAHYQRSIEKSQSDPKRVSNSYTHNYIAQLLLLNEIHIKWMRSTDTKWYNFQYECNKIDCCACSPYHRGECDVYVFAHIILNAYTAIVCECNIDIYAFALYLSI